MIRSFTLRDIALVHRLSEQGYVFHTRSALTQDLRPLREALVHMMVGGQYPTFVWKAESGKAVGFAQLRHGADETHAYILCLGSHSNDSPKDGKNQKETDTELLWLQFLEELIEISGYEGVHNLIAEVDESGDELPILRQVGFAVYTRQDVWEFKNGLSSDKPLINLTKAASVDEWDINLLYANIVPRLIQLVEPSPSESHLDDIWIVREKDELLAFLTFTDGSNGTWLRLFVHPNGQTRGQEILEAAIALKPPTADHPLYCCVRRYQSWVNSALEKVGFNLVSSQAMMVRHTVQHTKKLVPELSEEMKKKVVAARRNIISHHADSGGRPSILVDEFGQTHDLRESEKK